MNLDIIFNIEILKNLKRGNLITIIKDGSSKIYGFVGLSSIDEVDFKIIFSNPYAISMDELFEFNFRNDNEEIWILGNALKENKEDVIIQIVSQLKYKLDEIKNSMMIFESKKLSFIWNYKQLKALDSKTPITIISKGEVTNLCYLTYIDSPSMFLFCDYVIGSSPPIPHFSNSYIYSGDSLKVGVKSNYILLKEDYSIHLNSVVVLGIYGNYNLHCQEIFKIQIFQLENLICSYLGLPQSSIKKYKELLHECEVSPF